MNKKPILSAKLFSALSLALTAAAGVLFTVMFSVMMVKLYEPDVHYFKLDTPWFDLLVAGVVIFGAAVALLSLLMKKGDLPTDNKIGVAVTVAGILAGAGMLYYALTDLRAILSSEIWSETAGYVSGTGALFANRFNTVRTLSDIFAVTAALYFLLPAFKSRPAHPARVVCGFGGVVFFIFRLLVLYYDVSTPINSPVRMFDQMATVAAMLFLVYELRFLLSDPRPRIYVPIAAVSFVMMLSHAVSQMIAIFKVEGMIASLGACVFELLLAVYIFAGLSSYLVSCIRPAQNEPAEAETVSTKE